MRDQVTDVLLAMGYKVAQVAPEESSDNHALIASVGNDIGIEFHVNGKCQMGAQMVALSDDAAHAGQEHEERICHLIDQVLTTLQARQCLVRERFRSTLAPDEDLRVVELPAGDVQVTRVADAPASRRACPAAGGRRSAEDGIAVPPDDSTAAAICCARAFGMPACTSFASDADERPAASVAPRMAMPSADPTCRDVDWMPEA
jgi:hypothetical protein